MAAFPRIPGYHRISFCKSCKAKIRSERDGVYYCPKCMKKYYSAIGEAIEE
ncbi:MAG: hypothetical protein KJ574_00490 [Nanoarchaeota archaeon]|nr:hypothetical protein [Nanoarchaeota archaeon]